MDIISSGTVDIILAQTRARAASDKLYETQRVQSDVVCECGGTQRTLSLGWAGTENTRYTS